MEAGTRDDCFKLPRLYVDSGLSAGADIPLTPEQAHYFKTVLRRQDGDAVRLFNGRDGEWRCTLEGMGKKSGHARPDDRIREQPALGPGIHLFFAPIRKSRMDWLVEKAVELGATALHPVITQNTEVRNINASRTRQQMIEAAEQCERLDIPLLHDPVKLQDLKPLDAPAMHFMVALERGPAKPIADEVQSGRANGILVGPEGGFTAAEAAWITAQENWHPVSLGPLILRSETAACVSLSALLLQKS